ncbi:MAG: sugar ABC transporter permease [Firmicutes bacterium]|nr:sugar ABC transporter permease [Bacillota bacterium]
MYKPFSDGKAIALMVLPAVAFVLFAMVAPVFLSVYYGMTDWSGMGAMEYIGPANFREILFKDATFWRSLLNALWLAIVTIFFQNPLALLVCIMLLHSKKNSEKSERVFRTIYFIPAVISVVVTTRLWVHVFNPTYGLLNRFLSLIGLGAFKIDWLSNPRTALWSVILIVIWQGFGWAILFYYAGLVNIPKELQEAARIDGASGLKLYTKVILPLMTPVIRSTVIIALISCLKQMETVYLSTNGGPGDTTQFLANYLYLKAFVYGQYGYGCALSVIFVVVCVAGTVLLNALTQRDVGEF